jgi:hypothetical protein
VNTVGARNHWLGLRLVGAVDTPRHMPGAPPVVPGARTLWRRARADGSYARQRPIMAVSAPPRTRFGYSGLKAAPQEWTAVPVDRWTTLGEGGLTRKPTFRCLGASVS